MSVVAVVCMPERGHLQPLRPLIAALATRGATVHVFTARAFAADVGFAGGRFIDLFARFPLDAADAESVPWASRYVTYAGVYLEPVTAAVAALAPDLVVYDNFAVIAPLVARRLRVPYVSVCTAHAAVPARVVEEIRQDPRVATSAACHRAVERLRDRYGFAGAHPYAYVETLSPFLNLYCEPPQFLDEADRAAFAPLAFFGGLQPRPAAARRPAARPRVYVALGTVVWRSFTSAATAAVQGLAEVLGKLGAEVRVSLGGADAPVDLSRVERWVDQWAVLAESDVFVTHHGVSSTHEAIFHEVPMLSYPCFGDQPALARRCQALGLAVSLGAERRGPISPDAVVAAWARLRADAGGFAARLAEARQWELETIAARPAVIERILALL